MISQYWNNASSSQNFGTPYLCPYDITHSNQILHGDQTRWENFYKVKNAPGQIFVTQMLTRICLRC